MESLTIRTNLFDQVGRANILNNLGLVLINSGALDRAEAFLLEALSIYDDFNHKVGRCQVLHDLAGVHIVRLSMRHNSSSKAKLKSSNDYKKAKQYLDASLHLAKQLQLSPKIKQAEYNLNLLSKPLPPKGGSIGGD